MKLAVVYYDGDKHTVRFVETGALRGPFGLEPDDLSAYNAEDITAVVEIPSGVQQVYLSF